jgi:hypothetical protein
MNGKEGKESIFSLDHRQQREQDEDAVSTCSACSTKSSGSASPNAAASPVRVGESASVLNEGGDRTAAAAVAAVAVEERNFKILSV